MFFLSNSAAVSCLTFPLLHVCVNLNIGFQTSNLPGRTKTMSRGDGDNNKCWHVEGKKIPLSLWHRNLIAWRILSITPAAAGA